MTTGILEPTTNTLAVQNGEVYDYYRIKFGTLRGDFVDLEKMPLAIMEGYITYKGNLYRFTHRDYFRKHVNVGQSRFIPAVIAATPDEPTTSEASGTAAMVAVDTGVVNQPSVSDVFGREVYEDANMAWEEQIESLHHFYDSKEEWGDSCNTQSRSVAEGTPVQNTD